MKTHLLIITLIFDCLGAYAQPQGINYQGVARDSIGHPVISQNISLRLSILDGSASGSAVYVETQNAVTSRIGLFNVSIGMGSVVSGVFANVPWGTGDKWLKTEMDIAGGNNYVLIGTTQFMSVPYSYYSKNSGPKGTNIGDMQYWDGNSWVKLPAGQDGYALGLCNGIPTWGGCPITLTTNPATSIAPYSAFCEGNILNNNGTIILERGFCWNTSPNATISNNFVTAGTFVGVGNFTNILSALSPNLTYYVRSYAINSFGVFYGNEVSFTTPLVLPAIGQPYLGGILAYVLQPGDPGYDAAIIHGLIAAPSDQGGLIVWWNGSYSTTGATATALGTGNSNTNTIVSVQGSGNYAAKFCYDLVLNGYSDWYLPSKDELNLLYLNIGMAAQAPNTNIGGFQPGSYWSSSEIGNLRAWYQLGSGSQAYDYKYYNWWVRPVRTF